jgi:hypothetical protein
MNAMKWILGAVVATAILAPLQSANAWGGGPYGEGSYYESHPGPYGRGDYYGGYRGHYRGHRSYYGRYGYYGPHDYYRGHRGYYGRPGDYGRPGVGYRGPVVVAPPPW